MRVLHVMASGARGGGATHLVGLLPALRHRGIECLAAVGRNGPLAERLSQASFAVFAIDLMRSRLDASAPWRLRRVIDRAAPDLVHYHGTRGAFFGALLRRVLGVRVPAVYTAHGLPFHRSGRFGAGWAFQWAERFVCLNVEQVIAVARADLAELEARGMLAAGRGVHIANAIDVERFRPRDARAARTMLGLAAESFVVGTVSRLEPPKLVGDLIAAMAQMRGAALVVVGDGPERAQLEQQARALGPRVVFLGARDDVEQVLPAFDVFVLASRWEGEPVALLEAMAAGLACVATENTGTAEVLAGSSAGVLVPVGSPTALAEALARLRDAPAERAQMARSARAAVAHRSYGQLAAAVERVYEAVLSTGGVHDHL